jgi:hypothetical protein
MAIGPQIGETRDLLKTVGGWPTLPGSVFPVGAPLFVIFEEWDELMRSRAEEPQTLPAGARRAFHHIQLLPSPAALGNGAITRYFSARVGTDAPAIRFRGDGLRLCPSMCLCW